MSEQLWTARRSPHELGVIASGPLVLARAEGIAAALRCVFAHPDGLHLPLVLRADAARAADLARWSYGNVRRHGGFAGRRQDGRDGQDGQDGQDGRDGALSFSAPELLAQVNGRSGLLATTGPLHAGDDTGEGTGRGGAHVHGLDASYWIGELPTDGVLRRSFAWPQAGLAPTSTTVRLTGLEDLAERVVPLP